MAGVAEHSDYRGDPWGRLQRTSTFLAVTTFGRAADAQRAVDQVRGIHQRVHGVAPDGRPYHASDPHLLEWVHIAEVDSFLLAHQLYGAPPLDQSGRDGYVPIPPASPTHSACRPAAHREGTGDGSRRTGPELRSAPAARDAARYLLLTPPLPIARAGALRPACRRRRWRCCPHGRECRCCCPTFRRSRPPSSGWRAVLSSAASAGR